MSSAPARVALVVVACLLLAARYLHAWDLPAMARTTMLLRLQADYAGPVLARDSNAPRTREEVAATAAALERAQRITLGRVDVRGILWPKYVRVEVLVDGQKPPDGRSVRYFEIDALGNATALVSERKYYTSIW